MGSGAAKPTNRIDVREARQPVQGLNFSDQNPYWRTNVALHSFNQHPGFETLRGSTGTHNANPQSQRHYNQFPSHKYQQPSRYQEQTFSFPSGTVEDITTTPLLSQTNRTSTLREEPSESPISFETLRCHDGTEFVVLNQGGHRFYLDSFEHGEWQPLDAKMLASGTIVDSQVIPDNSATSVVVEQEQEVPTNGLYAHAAENYYDHGENTQDIYGWVIHPDKGKLPTLRVEERINVHYYFDRDQGTWIRMPLSLELKNNEVGELVDQIQEMLPNARDRKDILSILRTCNYSASETASTYLSITESLGDDVRDDATASSVANNLEIEELRRTLSLKESKINELESHLAISQKRCSELELHCQEKMATLEKMSLELHQKQSFSKHLVEDIPTKGRSPSTDKVVGVHLANFTNSIKCIIKILKENLSTLRTEFPRLFKDFKTAVLQVSDSVLLLNDRLSQQTINIDSLTELYHRECTERKLLYNQLQEIRGNIKVFCRCRQDSRGDVIYDFQNDQDILSPDFSGTRFRTFRFDKLFPPSTRQDAIYEEVKPLITSVVDGYNVCILAYGQTGSGKTHTMMGNKEDPGVNMRAIYDLLKACNAKDTAQYVLKVSLLEVYNEMLRDLLAENKETTQLDIHFKGRNVTIKGLTELEVQSPQEVTRIIDQGEKNRSIAETKMNSSSSRSHLILIIRTQGSDQITKEVVNGMLMLVDLAGSEKLSRTEATGQRLVEAAAINKSLTALGQVFTALRTKSLHIPYRNSKLTHLLQATLGGEGKACLFVNISPLQENLAETLSTLQFGSAARQIQLGKATKSLGVTGT